MESLGRIVVVGAGIGGLRACEELRREGFGGELVLIGQEREAPYDRTPLSKGVLLGTRNPESLALAPGDRLDALGLDLRLGACVTGLDADGQRLSLDDDELRYDGLIIAGGASPRRLPLLDGRPDVHVLRTIDDGLRLRAAIAGARHVVVVGAGFIGSEVASSARKLGCEVTIVELETTPLSRAIGHEMASVLTRLHADNGTRLLLGVSIAEVGEGSPLELRLSDETELEADAVVVGIGVVPNVDWLQGSGLALENGVVCEPSLCAGPAAVYAIGDLASWPNELFDRRMRVEHWMNAGDQGRHAARNLVRGTAEPFLSTNFVWSDQYDRKIQCVGLCTVGEVEVVQGSVESGTFLAWYRHEGRLQGALGIGLPKLLMQSKALIERRASWDDALVSLAPPA
jgi:NADPH-dependent 2,4-dienoyl-CoA reductase/sulfur reductase-like enzyme